MNNLNSILIEGNLVRDPEMSYTPKGVAVCKFAVASNRFYKQEEELQKEVSYFDVTTWMRLAEVCGEYLKKGRGVRVAGRLKQDRWTDPEGKGRSKVYIVGRARGVQAPDQKGGGPGGRKGKAGGGCRGGAGGGEGGGELLTVVTAGAQETAFPPRGGRCFLRPEWVAGTVFLSWSAAEPLVCAGSSP